MKWIVGTLADLSSHTATARKYRAIAERHARRNAGGSRFARFARHPVVGGMGSRRGHVLVAGSSLLNPKFGTAFSAYGLVMAVLPVLPAFSRAFR